jgi:arylsulfatase A
MWAVVCALIVLLPSTVMASDLRPNNVVVLADDLGYGDLACYGHPVIKTPHLDQFAREGLRFTDCYAAAANCSPARTGLMTGRTPTRVGIHNWIPMFSPMHVRRSEITIATLLRNAGYSTCHVGKWHLNGDFNLPSQPQPSDHGFDHWFSTQNNALPNNRNPFNFVRNGKPVGPLKGFAARLVADKAITWLEKGRDQEKSFFLYVCFHEPHEPIASDKRFGDL